MGQTEISQFLKDIYPKKYTITELSVILNVTKKSVSRCIRVLKKEDVLTFGVKKVRYCNAVTYGAKRKKWEI